MSFITIVRFRKTPCLILFDFSLFVNFPMYCFILRGGLETVTLFIPQLDRDLVVPLTTRSTSRIFLKQLFSDEFSSISSNKRAPSTPDCTSNPIFYYKFMKRHLTHSGRHKNTISYAKRYKSSYKKRHKRMLFVKSIYFLHVFF